MSIDRLTFLGFVTEMSKTSGVLSNLMHTGWHGNAEMPMGWRAGSGPITSKLPLGAKSLTLGVTAMQLPGALRQEDPTGQGRGRVERTSDLAGQTVGGLLGAGAGMKAVEHLGLKATPTATAAGTKIPFMQRGPLLGRLGRTSARAGLFMAPAMIGAGLAGKLFSAPSRAARLRRLQEQQREAGVQDQSATPMVGMRGSAAESPIAQEGQQGQMR